MLGNPCWADKSEESWGRELTAWIAPVVSAAAPTPWRQASGAPPPTLEDLGHCVVVYQAHNSQDVQLRGPTPPLGCSPRSVGVGESASSASPAYLNADSDAAGQAALLTGEGSSQWNLYTGRRPAKWGDELDSLTGQDEDSSADQVSNRAVPAAQVSRGQLASSLRRLDAVKAMHETGEQPPIEEFADLGYVGSCRRD